MVANGPAKKLTVYLDETDKFHVKPVYEMLLDIFFKKKIMGVSVFRGIAGYGSNGIFHTAKMLELSTSMPVKVEVVDSEEMINKVLPDVYHVVEKGMVEVTDTNIVKCCPKDEEKYRKRRTYEAPRQGQNAPDHHLRR